MHHLTHTTPTTVDAEAEFHRHAYNSAFNDLACPGIGTKSHTPACKSAPMSANASVSICKLSKPTC